MGKDSENIVKINQSYLEKINKTYNISKYFGDWINNTEKLQHDYLNAQPFEHIVIDNFLNIEYANELHDLFPVTFDNWYKYENPIEVKYTYDKIDELDEKIQLYFHLLSSEFLINMFRKLTAIEDLTYDEYLHGAGLHCHPKHGRLNIHLDYEKHPITGKERRLNVIYFLSKEWKSEWNGQNELWNKSVTECVKKTDVVFNRAIIFKTNDISWHGLPRKILCPEDHFRKSLAFYYVSPLNSIKKEDDYRKKAKYFSTNGDAKMRLLCDIRANRRLILDDYDSLYPNWRKEN